MQTKQLLYCIGEREAVRRRHDADEPRPWTKDQIFHEWSFTNVRREDDRVSDQLDPGIQGIEVRDRWASRARRIQDESRVERRGAGST